MNARCPLLRILPVIAGALVLFAAGCGREALTGPPELRVGRDQCLECGMLIAEDRCAAAAVVEVRGRREHVVFDDVSCMLEREAQPDSEFEALERFIRDYDTRTWLAVEAARFVVADPDVVPTPMGSGITAYATEARAKERAGEVDGEVAAYADLVQRTRAAVAERR